MTFKPGDLITVDFPGVTGVKRRLAVVLSSITYHANRPDVIIGLVTTQTIGLGVTDYALQDYSSRLEFNDIGGELQIAALLLLLRCFKVLIYFRSTFFS